MTVGEVVALQIVFVGFQLFSLWKGTMGGRPDWLIHSMWPCIPVLGLSFVA